MGICNRCTSETLVKLFHNYYNLNDFSVQRYMTQKENRDNCRPAHIRALTTFANESVPQDLLIPELKQALDGGLNWKIEIKVASLIEPQ